MGGRAAPRPHSPGGTPIVSADGKIPTVGGGADFRSGSSVDYSVFFK
ncbi:hypothetical protein [Kitasatospora griseola]|nr:hypothetical protein [Kitasatospora griseola]